MLVQHSHQSSIPSRQSSNSSYQSPCHSLQNSNNSFKKPPPPPHHTPGSSVTHSRQSSTGSSNQQPQQLPQRPKPTYHNVAHAHQTSDSSHTRQNSDHAVPAAVSSPRGRVEVYKRCQTVTSNDPYARTDGYAPYATNSGSSEVSDLYGHSPQTSDYAAPLCQDVKRQVLLRHQTSSCGEEKGGVANSRNRRSQPSSSGTDVINLYNSGKDATVDKFNKSKNIIQSLFKDDFQDPLDLPASAQSYAHDNDLDNDLDDNDLDNCAADSEMYDNTTYQHTDLLPPDLLPLSRTLDGDTSTTSSTTTANHHRQDSAQHSHQSSDCTVKYLYLGDEASNVQAPPPPLPTSQPPQVPTPHTHTNKPYLLFLTNNKPYLLLLTNNKPYLLLLLISTNKPLLLLLINTNTTRPPHIPSY